MQAMDLEFTDAYVKHHADEEEYSVCAFDPRFGDNLVVANFVYDNTHENGFYKERARFMAEMLANIINQ